MRGDGGVAGEGRIVDDQNDRISTQIECPTLPLACVLINLFTFWGCNRVCMIFTQVVVLLICTATVVQNQQTHL